LVQVSALVFLSGWWDIVVVENRRAADLVHPAPTCAGILASTSGKTDRGKPFRRQAAGFAGPHNLLYY